ncbi:hypothetical protein [Streptomyces sp. NPDC006012]|uniref:hypothetical protein n=1 Tax=Streptomyces sp. NPDC006012 TaxID=3364739 RepID=UPI00368C1B81
MRLNTWNPSFGAACHCHGFAPLACGRMTPALANAGFQISVFHVLAAIAFPYFVVSTRLNFFRSLPCSGPPHCQVLSVKNQLFAHAFREKRHFHGPSRPHHLNIR